MIAKVVRLGHLLINFGKKIAAYNQTAADLVAQRRNTLELDNFNLLSPFIGKLPRANRAFQFFLHLFGELTLNAIK